MRTTTGPPAGIEIVILDAGMELVPIGIDGDLYGGGLVEPMSLGSAAETAARLVPHPAGGPGARLYRTGRRGRWLQDGSVEWVEAPPSGAAGAGVEGPTSAFLTGPAAPAELEETVAAVWCELLARPHVGRNDDFFLLGGHSLLAARIMARLRQELGLDAGVRLLFEAPTVAALSVRLAWLPAGARP